MPHMVRHKFFTPLTWPVLSFAAAILLGAMLLRLPALWMPGKNVTWIDAFFTAVSAVCVTGLTTIEVGGVFNAGGQCVVLGLMQLGGLGISTYSSLIFVLWRNRVPFNDRLAVSQTLLNKDIFDLRSFVLHIVGLTLAFEGAAALLLWLRDPVGFHPLSAIFHAVSAFCNAGFSLMPDNLARYRDDVAVTTIFMVAIVAGGLGFAVLREIVSASANKIRHSARLLAGHGRQSQGVALAAGIPYVPSVLDRYSRMILSVSLSLILGGGLVVYCMELPRSGMNLSSLVSSIFHSVSARTAGFNTVDLTTYTEASLIVLMALMFIGGSPGSCAGGIKTTTFRVLAGFLLSQIRGDRQIVVSGRAVAPGSVSRALTLFFVTVLTISVSTALLSVTENGFSGVAGQERTPLAYLAFEVVSAVGTVGLSLNLTPDLSNAGKVVIMLNMFAGRVGFITLLAALQSLRPARAYDYPRMDLPIG